jgi:hypothetical protein
MKSRYQVKTSWLTYEQGEYFYMNMRKVFLLLIVVAAGLLALACQQPASKPAQSTTPSTPPASIPPANPPGDSVSGTKINWVADGVISEGEYGKNKSFGDYQISWSSDDSFIYIGMKAKTAGWVAVGFGPESMMKNADIVMGYIAEGKAQVDDTFSTGEFGPHPPDTQLGGTNDIIASAVKVDSGYTTVEFKRKFDTGDKYDKPVLKGTNKMIWACGSEPKATLKHLARGSGDIDF